jgi:hypothetical protein
VPRIAALLATGSHALIRVKSDIRLPRISPFAEDGSYLTTLSGGGTTVTMRVVEYHVSVDGQTTPELFCLVTDLLEHTTHPAHLLAQAYRWRWDGSETALREAKSAIHDAGHPRRRTRHRGEPALTPPGADPPRARRLDRRHRARPRRHPLRRRPRRTLPEGPPHRTAGRRPAAIVHHRPPHPDRHRPGRRRHRLAARTRPGRRPPARPGRDRHRPGHHRPTSPPRPQDQIQAAVPARTPRHHHPHCPRPRARLRHRGLTPAPSRPPEQDITPVRNPAHPARQPGRRRAPRPLSLSVHHSKITTKDPPLRERPHLPGIALTSHVSWPACSK